jgi:hypothetical protein
MPPPARLPALRTALVAPRIKQDEPELRRVHQLFDSWNGIGLISVGMRRLGMWLSPTHIADGEWRCVFMGDNPLLAPRGYGVAPTPWRAVQDAAGAAVGRS